MSLLMTSQPIVINRDLACRIGLNEAIVLQQLHYWLNETNSGTEHGGIRWVYNTTEQWLEQFPFWSESTLKRTFASLKSLGVLRREQLNKSKRDMSGEEQNVVVVIIVVHPVAAAGGWLHVITLWWKLLKRTAAGHAIFWRGNYVNH